MSIQYFKLRLDTLLLRYYLMMAVILVGIFSGWIAIAFFGLPIFLSAMLGITFTVKKEAIRNQVKTLAPNRELKKAS